MINISTPVFENEIKKPVNQFYLIDIDDGLNTKWLQIPENEELKPGTPLNKTYFNKIRNDLIALKDEIIKTKYYIQMNNKTGSDWEFEYSTLGFANVNIEYSGTGSKVWSNIIISIPTNIRKVIVKYNVKYYIERYGFPSETNNITVGSKTISRKWRYKQGEFQYSDISEIVDITDTFRTVKLINMNGKLTPHFDLRIEVLE